MKTTILRRAALLLLCVWVAAVASGAAQTVISTFNKVRVTSGASDALSVSGNVATGTLTAVGEVSALSLRPTSGEITRPDGAGAAAVFGNGINNLYAAVHYLRNGAGDVVYTQVDSSGLLVNGTTTTNTLTVTGTGTVGGTLNVSGAFSAPTVWGTNGVIGSDGAATNPGYQFLGNSSTGFYRDTSTGRIGWTIAGASGGLLGAGSFEAARNLGVAGGALGTGSVPGGVVTVGRNSSGAGAAGCVILMERGGSYLYLYVGGGLLRYNISSEGCPTENDAQPHSGSAIGDQTSSLATKTLLGEPSDAELLDAILRTRVHRFTYKDGRYNGETFTGIVTDESPWLAKDGGKALNEINGIGYLVGSVRALEARVRLLEQELAAKR